MVFCTNIAGIEREDFNHRIASDVGILGSKAWFYHVLKRENGWDVHFPHDTVNIYIYVYSLNNIYTYTGIYTF